MGKRRARKRLGAGIHPAWPLLRSGKALRLDAHPSTLVGFVRVHGCEPHGQVEDWVLSLPDGSRLHAHVFRDGTMTVHRDRWDPNQGPLRRIAHVALETRAGQLGLVALGARLAGFL